MKNKEKSTGILKEIKENKTLIKIIKYSVIGVGGLWLLNLIILAFIKDKGVYGDMFGAVNALFSGLAFAGIIITIIMQSQELSMQRDELKETREEFKTQNETLKIQRFENTFFHILELHHDIVRNMERSKYVSRSNPNFESDDPSEFCDPVVLNGRAIFQDGYKKMVGEIRKDINGHSKIYLNFFKKYHNEFGHYFRNLYRLIKLIDETEFSDDNEKTTQEIFETKYKYTSIVRAQLSNYELLWMFYNCLTFYGDQKFKPLIEKYALFKNLEINDLGFIEHKQLYQSSAYKKTLPF